MTQPKFAPIGYADEVRPAYRLNVPRPWAPNRPGDDVAGEVRTRSSAGPDQGYLSLLAEQVKSEIVLVPGEFVDDVLAGAIAIGMARAALFGRAPVKADLIVALTAFGFLSAAPEELVVLRAGLFGGVAHDHWRRHELVESCSDELLRATPATAKANELWRSLVRP
jgi:hypothetical protein